MNFKDAFKDDLEEAFFDLDEFAEEHTIDGVKMTVIKQEVRHDRRREDDSYQAGGKPERCWECSERQL